MFTPFKMQNWTLTRRNFFHICTVWMSRNTENNPFIAGEFIDKRINSEKRKDILICIILHDLVQYNELANRHIENVF